MAEGLVPLLGVEDAMAAIEAAATIGAAWQEPPPSPLAAVPARSLAAASLDEAAAKVRLAGWGVPVPCGRLVASVAEAVAASTALGYPVALKV